jgi:hypothetical protein
MFCDLPTQTPTAGLGQFFTLVSSRIFIIQKKNDLPGVFARDYVLANFNNSHPIRRKHPPNLKKST